VKLVVLASLLGLSLLFNLILLVRKPKRVIVQQNPTVVPQQVVDPLLLDFVKITDSYMSVSKTAGSIIVSGLEGLNKMKSRDPEEVIQGFQEAEQAIASLGQLEPQLDSVRINWEGARYNIQQRYGF
jgi:hypothetical protein